MNLRRTLSAAARSVALVSVLGLANDSQAQPPAPTPPEPGQRVELFDSLEENVGRTRPADLVRSQPQPIDLRQQMAIYRAQQRALRAQRDQWLGRNPSRPHWNAVPMMHSRYPQPQRIVPVYVYPR